MTTTTTYNEQVACVPRAGTLYDVIEIILDRGMVIDIFARVSLVGIEILKVDVRIVIASVDTYLRFAEACNRLDLETDTRSKTVPELFGGGAVTRAVGKKAAGKAVRSMGDKVRRAVGARDGDEDVEPEEDALAEEEALAEEQAVEEAPRPRRRTATKTRGSRPRTARRAEED
ncbi:gas vesicle structural protein GvpA [Streptomyces sp. Tu 2975]|uniref:gas vesicle protein GvpJ n=1 Tax=Streptomyces sp. Tu 2975 TaxID=2676871 RepID=UPI00135A50C1|nr:gas vesicle protein GvpJ [Streptomyces sp. Tu 2975]QIP83612.1 gas vesicle structural protein GvpA [Streptomyces sp. Tu 2975]